MRPQRHKQRYRNHHSTEELPLRKAPPEAQPFEFRVNRSLRPVLDKIGVPKSQPFIPDPFQIEALEALKHSDVLVTAPTGAGKTYIAIEAIKNTYHQGGKSWYASPLKALSNAKYEEFSRIFGAENVGILTGDRKENPHAAIIVGTTEILRNQLYDTMHRGEDLEVDLVVLDEAHYLGDKDRGVVWEEVLIYLPPRVRLLLLSATIKNAQEICDWLEWMRHAPCQWVKTFERPVPLFPLFLFPQGELSPLSTRRGMFAKIHSIERHDFHKHYFPDVGRLMGVLREANLLPAIFFLKSRADCEKAIAMCPPVPGSNDRERSKAFRARLNELLDQYPFLRHHQHLPILKKARVGAHHGGQLPHWKLLLEKLMQEGYLEAIFSTSTVAAGVNFPARTVVVPQSDRFNGKEFLDLTATDLLQMTGRAGRRGMDEIGFVLVIPGPHQDPQLIHNLLRSTPDPINSQIRINHSMVLNLLLSHKPEEIRTLFAASMATYQNLSQDLQVKENFEAAKEEISPWIPDMACGSLEGLAQVRPQYQHLKNRLRKVRRRNKRQWSAETLQESLIPARIFFSQRGTPYVAVSHPNADYENVDAVRIAFPLRLRGGRVRSYRVGFHRIAALGKILEDLPPLRDRTAWEDLITDLLDQQLHPETESQDGVSSESAEPDFKAMAVEKGALPCNRCALFGPCQKSTSHPFTTALSHYFDYQEQMHTIQDQLWQSFLQHYKLLQEEGYVDAEGRLTDDGLWASKLRMDQPLLISEGIRRQALPFEEPELLAALLAPFVMDRERPGDVQLSALVWKYPDLAKPFFTMLKSLQPLRERLKAEGFSVPSLPFWTVVTVYHWAHGATWEEVREIAGMDEGDLAMVILRTADHLRQIESLSETHPRLAQSARKAIELILREPVLVV